MTSPLRVQDVVSEPAAAAALPAPAEPADRAVLIDALRGFALFGVCLGNITVGFSFWTEPGTEALAKWTLPTDGAAEFLYHALVDGKFYSIFSLLFGLGFALQLTRRPDESAALALYRRRLRILAVIGFLHLALLWIGDILLFYALMGFLLLRLRGMEDPKLLRWVVLLLLAPVLFALPLMISDQLSLGTPFFILAFGVATALGIDVETPSLLVDYYVKGGWSEFSRLNLAAVSFRFGDLFYSGRPFKVLAMFLLGLFIGRHRAWERLDLHADLLRRVVRWGVVVGLPSCLGLAAVVDLPRAETLAGWRPVVESALYALGVAPLALAYAAGFVLLWRKGAWKRRLVVFAPTGRMALTNYLTQTILAITLFYGIGFGLGGRVGPSYFLPLALLILFAQTLFSHWWLARFRFGPMEWIWRTLTYRQRQPMRR